MPEFDPDDLIGRTFLLPPQENGERLRAKVTKRVVQDIEAEDANRIPNINFILDIGEGKVEELITYNQLFDHFEQAEEEDNFMDQEFYKFRAIIGHEGPLKATDPNWKGSKWNVQIECETPAHQKQPSSKIPTVFIRSRQDDADPSHIKPMPEFDPDDLIGRTFLLPPQENGERLRAKVTKKVVQDIEAEDANRIPNINFILDIGEGKVEELITYNRLLDHFEQAEEEDNFMDQELYKFRAIIGHEGPLKATDPNWKGSRWNVQIEWETSEVAFEQLSVIAAHDPITCAAYAKEKKLYNLDGWKRFRHLIKKEKQLTRAIKQSKIRQVRHSKKYMFGFLIPRNYTEALEFDKANNNSKWHDATKAELDSIHSYHVFQKHEKPIYDKQKKVRNAPPGYQKIRVHLVFAVTYDGRHKARLVAEGHLTPEPVESIYSGVVSLRNLKLVIFLGKLNNLGLWGADIGNAYLEAPTEEKLYIVAGPEFEDWEGYILTFSKALYGLKSSGKRWAETLHDILIDMDFIPSRADQCIWLKKNKKINIYEYIAVYVDDLCIAAQDPKEIVNVLIKISS